jgi:hypothetical protein
MGNIVAIAVAGEVEQRIIDAVEIAADHPTVHPLIRLWPPATGSGGRCRIAQFR